METKASRPDAPPNTTATGVVPAASLPTLPVQVLEALCKPLALRDRVALLSCCSALRNHQGLASSPALWSSIELGPLQLASVAKQLALAAWLHHHAAGLRRLQLKFVGSQAQDPACLQSLLGALGGTLLQGLQLDFGGSAGSFLGPGGGIAGEAPEAALAPLGAATNLTRLALWNCPTLRRLPPELSQLCRLADLDIGSCTQLGEGGDEACEPLAHLAPALTRLRLYNCSFRRLPCVLAALTGLADLDVSQNEATGACGEELFGLLQGLGGSLTRLDLTDCDLDQLLPPLAALTGLRELRLGNNWPLGDWGDRAFEPLPALAPSLTRLDLPGCQLEALPKQVSTLTSLRELCLAVNPGLGGAGAGASNWEVLRGLSALTLLDLKDCYARDLPQFLVEHPGLRVTGLGHKGDSHVA